MQDLGETSAAKHHQLGGVAVEGPDGTQRTKDGSVLSCCLLQFRGGVAKSIQQSVTMKPKRSETLFQRLVQHQLPAFRPQRPLDPRQETWQFPVSLFKT